MKTKLIIACFLFVSCSGGSESTSISGKNLAITVSGSRSFNPDIEHGAIDYYQVTISNEELEDPIVEQFAGDAENAKILNIPFGDNYTILVEAYNPNGLVIRRGQKEGIHIYRDQITSVDLVMNSVPIFTNLTNNSVVSNRRIEFGIFGEPGSQLEVLNMTSEEAQPIVDTATTSALIDTSNEEGLFAVTPQEFDYGVYSFQVKDMESGESSTIAVTLSQPMVRPALTLSSGGSIKVINDEMIIQQVGQPYYRSVDSEKDNLGNATLIEMMEQIY